MTDIWKIVPLEPTEEMIKAAVIGEEDISFHIARSIYRAMLAAAPEQPAVRVKQLEWENVGDGSFSGNSPIGKYLIFAGTGFSYELWAPVGGRIGVYKRREMAQAAAQADYDRSIISAIDLQPSDITALKAENKMLREAMLEAANLCMGTATYRKIAVFLRRAALNGGDQ